MEVKNNIISFLKGNYENSSRFNLWMFTFYVFLFFSYLNPDHYYYFDSFDYYHLSTRFGSGASFTLFNFFGGIRGYFFPFLLNIIYRFCQLFSISNSLGYILFSSAFYAFLIAVLIPKKVKTIYNYNVRNIEVLIMMIMIGLLWNGYFQCPLTDFYSAFFILISFLLLRSSKKTDYLFAGGFAAMALNMRPSYLFCYLLIILFIIINGLCAKNFKTTIQFISIFLGASLVIYLPQIGYDIIQKNTTNPLLSNNAQYGRYSDVKIMHLDYGLKTFKYETLKDFNTPKIFYYVPDKLKVIEHNYHLVSLKDYLVTVSKNPIKVIGIYALHFFVGVFQSSSQIYITKFNSNTSFYILVNGLIFYLFIYFMIKFRNLFRKTFLIQISILVLVSVITVLPTIVETRYFLLLHLFIYSFVAYSLANIINQKINVRAISVHLMSIALFCLLLYFGFEQVLTYVKIEAQ